MLCAVVGLLLLPDRAAAHDIPSDVRLRVFVKPEAQLLTLLVRVPMAALREIDVPLRPGSFIDLARAEPALREAVSGRLLDNLDLYEDGQRQPRPSIVQTRIALASDRSFADYALARAHLAAPRIAESEQLYWNQQQLDVQLQVPIALRLLPAAGAEGNTERAYELHGDPGLVDRRAGAGRWVVGTAWPTLAADFAARGPALSASAGVATERQRPPQGINT